MRETEVHSRLMYEFQRIRKVNIMSGAKISRMEFFALQVIGGYQQKTGLSGIYVSELAAQLKIASSQTSRMLKGLEERGLIGRSIDAGDRRNTCVFLTENGRETCRETGDYLKDYMERVLKAMGEERVEELISLCSELAEVMEQESLGGTMNGKNISISEQI
ncbi:MAG: winged helix-turn-helix transcriptional regulator [Lachnospiraceae bacterium]|nr:winged helix-turn-helix transcriptional regulator [Lachnospiraceae bacterium]